jgi:hypothetical protein
MLEFEFDRRRICNANGHQIGSLELHRQAGHRSLARGLPGAALALLLCLPIATRAGSIAWIDALFTATSALSVTGLTVVDTSSTYTLFGQVVILLLIQFGGLGIMTFAIWIFSATGWRVSMLQRCFIQDTYASDPTVDMKRLLRFIISFVLIVELLGAGLLVISLWGELSPAQNCYYALFHSISAFCNAGFTLFPDNFVVYQSNVLLNLTIAFLIIFGGIGFPVVFELLSWARKPMRTRLSLHTRIVLQTKGEFGTNGHGSNLAQMTACRRTSKTALATRATRWSHPPVSPVGVNRRAGHHRTLVRGPLNRRNRGPTSFRPSPLPSSLPSSRPRS